MSRQDWRLHGEDVDLLSLGMSPPSLALKERGDPTTSGHARGEGHASADVKHSVPVVAVLLNRKRARP
jgi:hypothetical protein